jgi:hypothetical protein
MDRDILGRDAIRPVSGNGHSESILRPQSAVDGSRSIEWSQNKAASWGAARRLVLSIQASSRVPRAERRIGFPR